MGKTLPGFCMLWLAEREDAAAERKKAVMVKTIIKRDGRTAEFHPQKIADAVEKSF